MEEEKIGEERQYHVGLRRKDIGGALFAVLPGDPGRVRDIALEIDPEAILLVENREYTSWLARLDDGLGIPVLITSTGIGCPSAAICIEELAKLGVKNFFRVGTSGSLQKHIKVGDIGIITASVREEGTSIQYVPLAYPAVADNDLVTALRMAAKHLGIKTHLAIGHTKDAFYAEDFKDETIPLNVQNKALWETWIKAQVGMTAMEASALFTVASFRKLRCAEILVAIGLTYEGDPLAKDDELRKAKHEGVKNMTRIVVEAIKILTDWKRHPENCPF